MRGQDQREQQRVPKAERERHAWQSPACACDEDGGERISGDDDRHTRRRAPAETGEPRQQRKRRAPDVHGRVTGDGHAAVGEASVLGDGDLRRGRFELCGGRDRDVRHSMNVVAGARASSAKAGTKCMSQDKALKRSIALRSSATRASSSEEYPGPSDVEPTSLRSSPGATVWYSGCHGLVLQAVRRRSHSCTAWSTRPWHPKVARHSTLFPLALIRNDRIVALPWRAPASGQRKQNQLIRHVSPFAVRATR